MSADAAVALASVRRLWAQEVEAADVHVATRLFEAATLGGEGSGGETDSEEGEDGEEDGEDGEEDGGGLLAGWRQGAAYWESFEAAFKAHPSYDNDAAAGALKRAMQAFATLLPRLHPGDRISSSPDSPGGGGGDRGGGGGGRELRRYLTLSRLAEGAKSLSRHTAELGEAVGWLEALVAEPLCAEFWAVCLGTCRTQNEPWAAVNNEPCEQRAL